jgi:hypothetical protein
VIPTSRTAKFKPGKQLKESLNGAAAAQKFSGRYAGMKRWRRETN